MEIKRFAIEGPFLMSLKSFGDDRGFFCERFRQDLWRQAGVKTEYIQENFSRSKPGVLRGLHYQWDPPQGKLVTCLRGRIFDVAVDIRSSSPTKGQHVAIELDGSKPQWFWIPAGFAHGFQVLGSEEADVMYKVDNVWSAKGEAGLRWDDPELSIPWPNSGPSLSSKDVIAPSWIEYLKSPRF